MVASVLMGVGVTLLALAFALGFRLLRMRNELRAEMKAKGLLDTVSEDEIMNTHADFESKTLSFDAMLHRTAFLEGEIHGKVQQLELAQHLIDCPNASKLRRHALTKKWIPELESAAKLKPKHPGAMTVDPPQARARWEQAAWNVFHLPPQEFKGLSTDQLEMKVRGAGLRCDECRVWRARKDIVSDQYENSFGDGGRTTFWYRRCKDACDLKHVEATQRAVLKTASTPPTVVLGPDEAIITEDRAPLIEWYWKSKATHERVMNMGHTAKCGCRGCKQKRAEGYR